MRSWLNFESNFSESFYEKSQRQLSRVQAVTKNPKWLPLDRKTKPSASMTSSTSKSISKSLPARSWIRSTRLLLAGCIPNYKALTACKLSKKFHVHFLFLCLSGKKLFLVIRYCIFYRFFKNKKSIRINLYF